jgi:hypothetical protein
LATQKFHGLFCFFSKTKNVMLVPLRLIERSEFDQSQEPKEAVAAAAVARTVLENQRAVLFSALLPIAVRLM